MLSLQQFFILFNINIFFWIMVTFMKCSKKTPLFSDKLPEIEPLNGHGPRSISKTGKQGVQGGVRQNLISSKKELRLQSHVPCPLDYESEKIFRSYEVNEKYKFKNIDRDKFIINVSPGEINSPEEQIRALKETIFLAVYLNRTLVLPNFFKSKNDFSVRKNIHEKRVVDPQDWISMIRMMRYIPVITLDELYEHCIEFEVGYVFEDPDEPNFTIDPFVVKEMDRLEKETGVKFLSRDDDTFRGTLIGPINSNSETDLKMNSKSIPNYFGQDHPKNYNARCVAVLNPKEIIPYGHHLKTWADMVGGGGTEDYVTLDTDLPLVSAMVMKSTGRPKWCKDIIDQFRTSWGLEKGFVTLVYDDNHLEVLTQEVDAVADKHRWTVVYVIIDNVYGDKENEAILEEISKLTKMSLMSRKTLTDFLLKKYKNCPKERFEDELDETIELLEQQIGFQSNAVVGSVLEGSETRAWVRNLRDERLAWRDHKLDFYLEGPKRMTGVMRGDLDYF